MNLTDIDVIPVMLGAGSGPWVGGSVAERNRYGSLKNKNDEYVWWHVLWRLPNFLFEARGYFDGGERDGQARRVAQGRGLIGLIALAYVAYAYPGYISGVQELVQTTGRLWPGVGTMLRFANSWQTSIVNAVFLLAAWIVLFALLMISITRLDALPGLLLRLRWPVAAVALFAGLFLLAAKPADWLADLNDYSALALIIPIVFVWVLLLKVIYLAATDVFRGDDAHPLLAPFVSTGVSWTLAYLALSSGSHSESGVPEIVRLLATSAGPVSVTGINVWTCQRIRREHDGDLLFLDGPEGSSRRPAALGGGGPSRREVLRYALPPAILIGTSPCGPLGHWR